MIKLIVGEKGSGKTKVLIDMVNKAAETSNGNVVCIEKAMHLQYCIKSSVRLIHADEYQIRGYDQFYGFMCGVLAGNYDIRDIYVDGILRIGDHDLAGFVKLIDRLQKLIEDEVSVIFSVSIGQNQLPEGLKQYVS